MRYLFIIIILAVMAKASPAAAEIYQYTDENGNIIITDNPPAGVRAEKKSFPRGGVQNTRPGRNAADSEALTTEATGPGQSEEPEEYRKSSASVDVIMYSAPWCGYCTKARAYIRSLGVSFTEYDIDQDAGKKKEMMRKSGGSRGVPLIDVEGIIIRGYHPERIKAAVEKKRTL